MMNAVREVLPEKETNHKLVYIEYIRAAATLAVVFLHIVMTLPANYSASELGRQNYAVLNVLYMLTRWAVPCFLMVSGVLLLEPNKQMSIAKVICYLKRMFLVLAVFGSVYALMEFVFHERTVSIEMLPLSVLYTAQGMSWNHLWYLYVLISLYLLLMPLRCIVSHIGDRNLNIFVCVLIAGNFVIPTVNVLFNYKLEDYMILNEYATYFILGYWLLGRENKMGKAVIVPGIMVTAAMVASEVWSIFTHGESFALNHESKDILTLIQAVSVFIYMKECFFHTERLGKIASAICRYSFAIYLIHPFFINLLYKAIGITPLSLPYGLGIPVLFAVVFAASLGAAAVLKRIPLIQKLI